MLYSIYARNTDGTDGALLIGNNVRQNQDNGGRTYEVSFGDAILVLKHH